MRTKIANMSRHARNAVTALLILTIASLAIAFMGQLTVLDFMLKLKNGSAATIVFGLLSIGVYCARTFSRIKRIFSTGLEPHKMVRQGSFPVFAAAFLAGPTAVYCVGYLIDSLLNERIGYEGYMPCAIFCLWGTVSLNIRYYLIWLERPNASRPIRSARTLILLIIVTTLLGVIIGRMSLVNEPPSRVIAVIFGLIGSLSAIDCWWEAVWNSGDSELLEVGD